MVPAKPEIRSPARPLYRKGDVKRASQQSSPVRALGYQGVLRVVLVVQRASDGTAGVVHDALEDKAYLAEIAEQTGFRLQRGMSPIVAVLGAGFTQEESSRLASQGIYVFDRNADQTGVLATHEALLDHLARSLIEGLPADWLALPPPPTSGREPVLPPPLPEKDRRALIEQMTRSLDAL